MLALLAALPLAPSGEAAAQLRATALPAACPGESPSIVTAIDIESRSVFEEEASETNGRLARIYALADALHVRTRDEVIRRTLLFEVGDCYDPAVVSESERVLRGHPFLASVNLSAEPQPDGSRRVVVRTRDEWSIRGDLRVRMSDGPKFRGARLEEMNLLGTGRVVALYYDETARSSGYGMVFRDPQLRGSRWTLAAELGRTDAGGVFVQSLTHPFFGDFENWAALQGVRREARHFEYVIGTEPTSYLLVPVRRRGYSFGGLYRSGEPGRQTLLGVAVSFDDISYPGGAANVLEVSPEGERTAADPDSPHAAAVAARMVAMRHIRFFFLVGQRNLSWVARRGLDSIDGLEDVAVGTEAELAIGPPFPGDDTRTDLFARLRLYAGLDGRVGTGVIQIRAEGQRDSEAPSGGSDWRDVLLETELLGYARSPIGASHQLFVRVAAAGGWDTRGPLQLTLGGDHGIRGYRDERFPGGRRVVLTLEDRFPLGRPFGDLISLGGAVFLDLGRMWAGDALFGADSGWRAGGGIALRGAFPPGSRTPFRLDLGVPIEGAGRARPTLRFTVGDPRGLYHPGDPRLIRSRFTEMETRRFHFPTTERRWP